MSENRPVLDLSRTDFVDFDRIPFPALLLLGGRMWYLPCLAEAAMVVDRAVAATIDLIWCCWQDKSGSAFESKTNFSQVLDLGGGRSVRPLSGCRCMKRAP